MSILKRNLNEEGNKVFFYVLKASNFKDLISPDWTVAFFDKCLKEKIFLVENLK